jgi:hypothetical protein
LFFTWCFEEDASRNSFSPDGQLFLATPRPYAHASP